MKLTKSYEGGPWLWLPEEQSRDTSQPTILLDRDGTLIKDAGQNNLIENLEFLEGSIKTLELLSLKGYGAVIITNQAGISKGLFDLDTLDAFHNALYNAVLDLTGFRLNAIVACPHQSADNCNCRKPKPGMIVALQDLEFANIKVLFGDTETDLQTVDQMGILGIKVSNGRLLDTVQEWVRANDPR